MTPEAAILWSNVSKATRRLILKNVYCAKCRDATEFVNFSGKAERGNLILTGSCARCGGNVARLLETSELNPDRN